MAIAYEKDADGIVLLTIDMPDRSANVLNEVFFAAFREVLDKLADDTSAVGAVLVSAKKLWIAGADIDTSFNSTDPAHFFDMSEQLKRDLRRLETVGKPVVAALNGTALGGGLEVALSCTASAISRKSFSNRPQVFGFVIITAATSGASRSFKAETSTRPSGVAGIFSTR